MDYDARRGRNEHQRHHLYHERAEIFNVRQLHDSGAERAEQQHEAVDPGGNRQRYMLIEKFSEKAD